MTTIYIVTNLNVKIEVFYIYVHSILHVFTKI